jgi:DNA-binding XRE family transcriptional regulator
MSEKLRITPQQVRAARAWLAWGRDKLAETAGLSTRSIARYEQENLDPTERTLESIRSALESNGIIFDFEGTKAIGISFDLKMQTAAAYRAVIDTERNLLSDSSDYPEDGNADAENVPDKSSSG